MFFWKGVLRNFAKFTGKHLCQSLYFNKVAGLRLWHSCFSVKFAKFLRTLFLTEHLILSVCPDFTLSRTPQISWQKHTSKHFFYRTAPSGCFLLSVIFLKKGKTETIFTPPLSLIRLKSCNCIKFKILFIHHPKKTTRIYRPIFSIQSMKNDFMFAFYFYVYILL